MSRFRHKAKEDPMCALNRMVIGICYEDLPASVVEHAKHSILDTLAVIIGGSSMEGISLVVDYVKEKGGNPQSVLPFYGGKVLAPHRGHGNPSDHRKACKY